MIRLLRERDIDAGPILAPWTAAALAGTTRSVASMDVVARTNALSAIADLIGRARPELSTVRVALARSAPILSSAEPRSVIAASLDHLADEFVADLRPGNTRLAARLEAATSTPILLAATWSRQSLGDPWLVADLLRDSKRTIVVAQGGAAGDGDLVAGWVDPAMRPHLEVVPDVSISAILRAGACEAVLLSGCVHPDGTVTAARARSPSR